MPLEDILKGGVKSKADVNGFASRSARSVDVMVWNYHDDDVEAPETKISVPVSGLPAGVTKVLIKHYRVDRDHSNSYAVWKSLGSPQQPTPEQYAKLSVRSARIVRIAPVGSGRERFGSGQRSPAATSRRVVASVRLVIADEAILAMECRRTCHRRDRHQLL